MYLESFGHQIQSARTFKTAVAALVNANCDVLISDIGLADGDGLELMRREKFSNPVYAIAISGFGTNEDKQRSKAAGFRHHLVKPIGGQVLARILEEAARELATETDA